MLNEQQQETATNRPVPAAQPQLSHTLTKIPSIELLDIAKGFTSFYSGMHSRPSMNSRSPPSRQNQQTRHLSITHDVPSPVSSALHSNKINLSQLRTRVVSRRKTQYDEYIANSVRYNKLLELNNMRSKILTSLNNKKVGQIKVTLLDQRRPEDIMYELREKKLQIQGWKPQSREGQVCLVHKDTIVLVGGHNNDPLDTICVYRIRENEWVRSRTSDNDLKRTYHTGVLYRQNYMIVFGGMSSYNPYYKTRECLNSCCLISLGINPPQLKRIKIANEEIMEPRRNHSAVIIGKYMLVFGGANTKKNYLNDLKVLDLKQLKWEVLEYKVESEFLASFMKEGLAKHCAFTYFNERESYPLYSKTYEQAEGMYLFGGCNQLGSENGLLRFCLKWRTPKLERLQPAGYSPSSVQPIVAQYNRTTFILISGERQQREVRLYRVKQNQYVTVRLSPGSCGLGGIGSSLIANRQYFYVLFGLGQQGYIGSTSQLDILQKYRQKPNRGRRGTIDNIRASFFRRYTEDSDTDNVPGY